jgi:uncharacterized membrane protein
MAQLLVFGVDSPQTAEQMLDLAGDLHRQELLQPGKAAVFFLARNATGDRVIEAIRPYNPTVIQTNLSRESERELIEALQRDYLAGLTATTIS